MAASRIEAVMEHLTYTKGVVGVVLCTMDGVPIRDSFQHLDRSTALTYTEMASSLARTASLLFLPVDGEAGEGDEKKKKKGAKDVIEADSLELIRVRTRMNEIIVKRGDEFLIVVVQEPGE
eukprot:gene2029-1219_t